MYLGRKGVLIMIEFLFGVAIGGFIGIILGLFTGFVIDNIGWGDKKDAN